eukprot:TRINITY_DN3425_c0_g1_i1.p2 TRINITY_DN3425_c0_g1~~TRINITY_DN3425_c0_g1_i1.p2  ORF type:complete len:125 (+),score=47.76 TRINITY_DN3425_c0_g1_i1:36-377(+)
MNKKGSDHIREDYDTLSKGGRSIDAEPGLFPEPASIEKGRGGLSGGGIMRGVDSSLGDGPAYAQVLDPTDLFVVDPKMNLEDAANKASAFFSNTKKELEAEMSRDPITEIFMK